ncbi:hypothetical protein SDC9_54083 [bioreactor metagenome]|uniref:Uncharacterized protein n=1 Tax=bioreactor metagenome TaxID=1076179 RepID=A0A644WV32_9ZZZZ
MIYIDYVKYIHSSPFVCGSSDLKSWLRTAVTNMKKESARENSLKITIIYFIVGCAWIFLSDRLVQVKFSDQSQVLFFSIAKGIGYVFVTSVLIFTLIYRALKKELEAKKQLTLSNSELEQSNKQYKELYMEFNRKQALLKSLMDSVPDLIFYKDLDSVYLGCNTAFETFAGKAEQDIVGSTDADLFSPETAALFKKMDVEMMKTNSFRINEENVAYPDGTRVILETLKTPYCDFYGNIIGLIGVSRDITERKSREDTIRYLSYHDALTGIYNRAYFQEAKELLDSADYLPLSVIVCDVNGMKLINDAFGHSEGDKLLREIAEILMQCSRKEDIVTRIGGDEFSVLMPHTNNNAAREVVEHIRAMCEERRLDQAKKVVYTDIALGFATRNDIAESLDKTIILAEDLMYRRKLLEHKSLHSNILGSIKSTMFEKSNETEEHAERLAELSKKLGKVMGLTEEKLDELELVSTLHDLGKIGVDKNILTKPDELSDTEWREIKKHPEIGFRIANSTPELRHIAEYILCHHERWDGTGYPLGLSETDIPLISRIIAVVDTYDAMTQDRAYRKALSENEAIAEILGQAGTQFDPDIAKVFVEKVLHG